MRARIALSVVVLVAVAGYAGVVGCSPPADSGTASTSPAPSLDGRAIDRKACLSVKKAVDAYPEKVRAAADERQPALEQELAGTIAEAANTVVDPGLRAALLVLADTVRGWAITPAPPGNVKRRGLANDMTVACRPFLTNP